MLELLLVAKAINLRLNLAYNDKVTLLSGPSVISGDVRVITSCECNIYNITQGEVLQGRLSKL